MLIHPIVESSNEMYPIGSIIEANAPPSSNWMICDGQILAQASYPTLYSLMDDPHPTFQDWEVIYIQNAYDYFWNINYVIYDGSQWVGSSYGYMVYTSNPTAWSYDNVSVSGNLGEVAYDGSIYVSVKDSTSASTDYLTSTDGQNWTARTLPFAVEARQIPYDGTYFYLIDNNGINVLRSSDGLNWTRYQTLPDTNFEPAAASSTKLVTMSSNGIMAVSDDAAVTFDVYNNPRVFFLDIIYDSSDDVFIASGYEGIYGISDGSDGVEWEFNRLPITRYGTKYNYLAYGTYAKPRIRKAGSYYFGFSYNCLQGAYSSDLKSWTKFPMVLGDYRAVIYDSSTGYYYMMGDGPYHMRFKEVNYYDDSTYFMLPKANNQHHWKDTTKMNKYIRVS